MNQCIGSKNSFVDRSMIGIMQEARRLHDSCHGSTPVPIKISPGMAQERTTGSIYPKRTVSRNK